MKKIYRKRVIGIVLLIVTLVALFIPLQEYFGNRITNSHMRIEGFYLEKKNSLDIGMMGASEVYYGWHSNEAYRVSGLTSYPYALPGNPPSVWKYELKEIMRRQKPKVLIVETNGVAYGNSNLKNKSKHKKKKHKKVVKKKNYKSDRGKLYYKLTFSILKDTMPMTENKRAMLKELSKHNKVNKVDKWFPFVKYHGHFYSNMKSEVVGMKKRGYSSMKGIFSKYPLGIKTEEINIPKNVKPMPLDPMAEKYLREFIKIAKEMGIRNIVFVRFPHKITSEKALISYRRHLRAGEIIRKEGYEYIDFTMAREKIGISSDKDFADSEHLNANGARKFTTYFSQYLKEKYKIKKSVLPESEKSKWDEGAKLIEAYYKYYNDYPKKHNKLKLIFKEFTEKNSVMKDLKQYMDKYK